MDEWIHLGHRYVRMSRQIGACIEQWARITPFRSAKPQVMLRRRSARRLHIRVPREVPLFVEQTRRGKQLHLVLQGRSCLACAAALEHCLSRSPLSILELHGCVFCELLSQHLQAGILLTKLAFEIVSDLRQLTLGFSTACLCSIGQVFSVIQHAGQLGDFAETLADILSKFRFLFFQTAYGCFGLAQAAVHRVEFDFGNTCCFLGLPDLRTNLVESTRRSNCSLFQLGDFAIPLLNLRRLFFLNAPQLRTQSSNRFFLGRQLCGHILGNGVTRGMAALFRRNSALLCSCSGQFLNGQCRCERFNLRTQAGYLRVLITADLQ